MTILCMLTVLLTCPSSMSMGSSTTAARISSKAILLPTMVEPTTIPSTTTTSSTTTPPTTEPSAPQAPIPASVPPPAASNFSGACGGRLPPCWVLARESGGNIHIYNSQGSGASGKWQIMPGTWGGYDGYANAADAPENIQDARAAEIWDGGKGCAAWAAC